MPAYLVELRQQMNISLSNMAFIFDIQTTNLSAIEQGNRGLPDKYKKLLYFILEVLKKPLYTSALEDSSFEDELSAVMQTRLQREKRRIEYKLFVKNQLLENYKLKYTTAHKTYRTYNGLLANMTEEEFSTTVLKLNYLKMKCKHLLTDIANKKLYKLELEVIGLTAQLDFINNKKA